MTRSLRSRIALALLTVVFPPFVASAAPPSTRPVEGLRENTPEIHALTGARIVVAPGRVIEKGTLVIRDGVIEAAGADVAVPDDARVWDLSGKTLYPGLVEAYTTASLNSELAKNGAPHWSELVTPQLHVGEHYTRDADVSKKLRSQGVALRLVAPAAGIIRGTSAVATTGDDAGSQAIVRDRVALHMQLTVPPGRGRRTFPNSPMGAVALARQAMLDGQWHREAWTAYLGDTSLPRPERNDALEALAPYLFENGPVIIDANDEQYFLRADRFAREFGLNVAVLGSGHEYRRLEAIRETGRTVIVPVNFPKAPNVATPEAAMNVELESLLHWDHAPENAARLHEAGVKIALTSHRLSDRGKFLEGVRQAVVRGLPAEAALAAMTITPAGFLGLADRAGTLEAGKAAHVLVTDGDLFAEKTKVLETWVDGKRYEHVAAPKRDVRGRWRLTFDPPADEFQTLDVKLTGEPEKLSGVVVVPKRDDKEPSEIKLENVNLRGARLAATFPGEKLNREGVVRLSAVVSLPEDGEATWQGTIVFPGGETHDLTAVRTVPAEEVEAEKKEDAEKKEEPKDAAASFAVNYPLGAFGRDEPPEQPAAIVFQNATVWTCGEQGILRRATVVVREGKIAAVGRDVEIPEDAVVLDAAGKHITPGIIDCHSHMATDGGINEATQAITAEVRIGDFIDATDISIYRQLAGGVTAANILHGSANPIGGQNQVIKLRWGALPEEMKFAEAPPGIKFALGENVKQSNWGDEFTSRYPQSRMGVEQIMRDAFHAARQYRREHERWRQDRRGLPPRVDLELEALAEIVEGKRWIHCHSYRQDEILALLRTLEEFEIRIGTLQHILEGYKVADAMAAARRHGLCLLRLVGVQVRGLRRDPLRRRADAPGGGRGLVQLGRSGARPAFEPGGGQGDQVRRRSARGGAQVRHHQSGEAASHRAIRRLAGSGQTRRPRGLERSAALELLALRADLDRRPQAFRPRGRPRPPRRGRPAKGAAHSESARLRLADARRGRSG
jgi:imidazolonepropionase-like amidohydrolase